MPEAINFTEESGLSGPWVPGAEEAPAMGVLGLEMGRPRCLAPDGADWTALRVDLSDSVGLLE